METPPAERKSWWKWLLVAVVAAGFAAGIAALLVNIVQRKTEAKQQFLKLVEVDENTTDPAVWGTNWPREYDSYLRTAEASRTNFGGGDATPAEKLKAVEVGAKLAAIRHRLANDDSEDDDGRFFGRK